MESPVNQGLTAILCNNPVHLASAREIAARLGVALKEGLLPREMEAGALVLNYDQEGLHLQSSGAAGLSVWVDFVGGKLGYRRAHHGAKTDLEKAIGIQAGIRPKVWDVTAGLGQDAFILASQGCDVHLFERNPVVLALLEDGLRRARAAEEPALKQIIDRMQVHGVDGLKALTDAPSMRPPEVIYLDPMFPERSKSALVNKNMQLFHRLVVADEDAEDLFLAALHKGVHRIVVKRPRLAPALGGEKAPLCFSGKAMRFDVYPFKKLQRATSADSTTV